MRIEYLPEVDTAILFMYENKFIKNCPKFKLFHVSTFKVYTTMGKWVPFTVSTVNEKNFEMHHSIPYNYYSPTKLPLRAADEC